MDRHRAWIACVLSALALTGAAVPARAWVEEALVVRITDQSAVVQRASGDLWALDLGNRCLVLNGYQGRSILIFGPTAGSSAEMKLIAPEYDITCPVMRADSLGRPGHAAEAMEAPVDGLGAMRQALELLGYNCGTGSELPWGPLSGDAFRRFREGRKIESSPHGLRRGVTALALEVMRTQRSSGTSLKLAQTISNYLDPIVAWLASPGAGRSRCGTPTWITKIESDGSLVSLGDGSKALIAEQDRARVAQWQSSDDLFVCSERLVNWRNGELARIATSQR